MKPPFFPEKRNVIVENSMKHAITIFNNVVTNSNRCCFSEERFLATAKFIFLIENTFFVLKM